MFLLLQFLMDTTDILEIFSQFEKKKGASSNSISLKPKPLRDFLIKENRISSVFNHELAVMKQEK
jgi:hypothetical protein